MKYAVYILGPGDKNKKKDLVKDKSGGAMFKAAVAGFAEDLMDLNFYDPVAKSLTDEKSVAISGKMITVMEHNTSLILGTRYEISRGEDGAETGRTNVYTKMLKHTLTVKGILEANNAMFGIPGLKEVLQKKDLSRVWKWANTHFDAAEDDYYRDIVAISYSTEQDRYRALIMNKAVVGNYEEHFDKDGMGHFTLVVSNVLDYTMDPADTTQVPASELAGPTFDFSFTQFTGSVGTAVSATKKAVDKGIEVAGKFGVNTKDAQKFSKSLQKGMDISGDVIGGKLDITPTNIANQIENSADLAKMVSDEPVEKTTTEFETTTEKNSDGTTTVTETKKNPDGTKTVKKTTKNKEGKVIKVENEKIKA